MRNIESVKSKILKFIGTPSEDTKFTKFPWELSFGRFYINSGDIDLTKVRVTVKYNKLILRLSKRDLYLFPN